MHATTCLIMRKCDCGMHSATPCPMLSNSGSKGSGQLRASSATEHPETFQSPQGFVASSKSSVAARATACGGTSGSSVCELLHSHGSLPIPAAESPGDVGASRADDASRPGAWNARGRNQDTDTRRVSASGLVGREAAGQTTQETRVSGGSRDGPYVPKLRANQAFAAAISKVEEHRQVNISEPAPAPVVPVPVPVIVRRGSESGSGSGSGGSGWNGTGSGRGSAVGSGNGGGSGIRSGCGSGSGGGVGVGVGVGLGVGE